MSATDKLREVMNAPHDLVQDDDTDAVSVNSSTADDEEPFYDADCIVAEDSAEEACYLVKWEDYPLHECTWEPPAHLDGTSLISSWEQVKQELGEAAFQRENESNIAAFEKARERAAIARERKYAKRDKKRRILQRRHHVVVSDGDSSDEGSLAPAPAKAKSTTRDSLFVDPQGLSVSASPAASPSREVQPLTIRKAPVQQSSSEESGPEIVKKDGGATRNLTNKPPPQSRDPKPAAGPSRPALEIGTVREMSKQRPTVSAVSSNPATKKPNRAPAATNSNATVNTSSKPAAMRAIRTIPQKQPSRAINIIDRPIEQQRKAWSTNNHYSKANYRYLAEKRSRTEGPIDFSALDFVNGPPPTLPKVAAPRPSEDPYGRREIANLRAQEDDPDDRPRRGNKHDPEPLKDWAVGKVPQICASWRLKRNCEFGAQKCRFMHRDRDPQGREYPVGVTDGWVPFKYRDPPITCLFWYKNGYCKKSTEQCVYAHEDTGWTELNGKPIRIERLPEVTAAAAARDMHAFPLRAQNLSVTCPFWLRGPNGCSKSEQVCKYAHRNTGLAPPDNDIRGPPVPIDPSLRPRRGPPKYADPPVTCPFWLRSDSGCSRTDDECIYAHRNTGWAPSGLSHSQPLPVDPQQLPRKEFLRSEPGVASIASRQTNSHGDTATNAASSQPTIKTGAEIISHLSVDTVGHEKQAPEHQVIQSPLAPHDVPLELSPPCISSSQLNRKIESLYNLSITKMFHSGTPEDDKMLELRAMLLYHPEDQPEDLELITRWLLVHKVEVGNLWYDGAWNQFQQETSKGKSGIVIVHPDFDQYVDLPGFGEVLKQRVRVWSVGLQPSPEFEQNVSSTPPALQYNRAEVFPHGGFIYITDDVFEQKPQLALSIVKHFFAKIEQLRNLDGPVTPSHEVDDACLLWRLCVRPELMDYLYRKCEDNSADLAAGDLDSLSRAELYQLLTLTNYIEQDHPIEPLSLIQDKYPILSERRVIAEHEPLNYFNRLANSQEDANTNMIGYYAALQTADMRRAYRQFFVVHTDPDAACAQQWKASIHNIADVITPERCVEELSKSSRESLFDFLDWAMAPKEKRASDAAEAMDLDEPTHADTQ